MAITLNKEAYTDKQIELVEPLIRTIEKYDREIDRIKNGLNLQESFEQAKLKKDKIANLETKKKAVGSELEKHLNARNEFDELVYKTISQIKELGEMSGKYGFKLNEKQMEALK